MTYRHNTFNRALMRRPADNTDAGLTSQSDVSVDNALMKQQYEAYTVALRDCGLELDILSSDDRFPDGHYVEDTAVLYDDMAFICQPPHPIRAGEPPSIAAELTHLRCIPATDDATIEGGDVLFCADRVLIGLSERTNLVGAEQLRAALHTVDSALKVDFVSFSGVLHLKSGITELAPGVILKSPDMHTDYDFGFTECITLPPEESYAADVLPVNDAVLIPDGFPTVGALADKHYARVYRLNMSEFEKMDGGVTCLSLRYRS
ncbi:MAG: arginine deiminase family protein [Aggregatilineales bacterium]